MICSPKILELRRSVNVEKCKMCGGELDGAWDGENPVYEQMCLDCITFAQTQCSSWYEKSE